MNIYTPFPDCDNYDSLYRLDQEKSFDILQRFLNMGKYQDVEESSIWTPLEVRIESLNTKRGDFFSIIARKFASTQKAWNILAPLIENNVQLLPLKSDDGDFNILKVINTIDCLDHTKADIFRSPETNRVLRIRKYVFKTELIQNQHFFSIPESKFGILVSQSFKDLVEQNNLKGLKFEQVA